jgi:hypothetical protein
MGSPFGLPLSGAAGNGSPMVNSAARSALKRGVAMSSWLRANARLSATCGSMSTAAESSTMGAHVFVCLRRPAGRRSAPACRARGRKRQRHLADAGQDRKRQRRAGRRGRGARAARRARSNEDGASHRGLTGGHDRSGTCDVRRSCRKRRTAYHDRSMRLAEHVHMCAGDHSSPACRAACHSAAEEHQGLGGTG